VIELGDHPAVLAFALGNEIPSGVVRWHGRMRVERFLRDLYNSAKSTSPDSLFTYVNFPPTEFLDLPFFDICAFNVYLHREPELRAYLARLQHIAGQKPLLLAEAGADSLREGEARQAEITAMHVRAAFEEGACGAIAFAWTDEWWRGGHPVDDWKFGLVDGERRLKPAAAAVAAAFDAAPFSLERQRAWPRVSDVVGAGGPNVVPPADPPIAQCIARAPGGPTHVLLDDRIAEHVPGCNMAFRRDALLAIDGFNPIYLRAGDDVDVCWRLQARGWKIGFAPAALVWHHHRTSVNTYWKQQIGYGEGDTWLMEHHPDKFLDSRKLWRGRIYSPLPVG